MKLNELQHGKVYIYKCIDVTYGYFLSTNLRAGTVDYVSMSFKRSTDDFGFSGNFELVTDESIINRVLSILGKPKEEIIEQYEIF